MRTPRANPIAGANSDVKLSGFVSWTLGAPSLGDLILGGTDGDHRAAPVVRLRQITCKLV
jgi:hypothetical protein